MTTSANINLDGKRSIELLHPGTSSAVRPLLILAHGAGSGMRSNFMTAMASHLEELGIGVLRFNFPYVTAGRKIPDRSPVLEESWRSVVRYAQDAFNFSSLFIGGKSMGARIASMVAAEMPEVRGLVFLGYPLHSPGKFDQIRDAHLPAVAKPMLFQQGTRDTFARKDLLQSTVRNLKPHATLQWVEGGDHSYKVLVRSGLQYEDVLRNAANGIAEWIRSRTAAQ